MITIREMISYLVNFRIHEEGIDSKHAMILNKSKIEKAYDNGQKDMRDRIIRELKDIEKYENDWEILLKQFPDYEVNEIIEDNARWV